MFRGILVLIGLSWLSPTAWPKPVDHVRAADFFMKYYQVYREQKVSSPRVSPRKVFATPPWFQLYCSNHQLPVDCHKQGYTPVELQDLLQVFYEAKYNSLNGGVIAIAITVAKNDPRLAFSVLEDLSNHFADEFQFEKIKFLKNEKAQWQNLLHQLPLKHTMDLEIKGEVFKALHRTNGRSHSLVIENKDGEVVFTDGPRWVLHKNDPSRAELISSLTTTWTVPDYRSFGLYQWALRYYLNYLGLHRTRLYTENEETLEFIYRMKQLVYKDELRSQLLQVPGLGTYLEQLGVDVERFSKGHLTYLRMAENLLSYLSLQGRTRLNLGMSFRLDQKYPAIVRSREIRPSQVQKIKDAANQFEETLKTHLPKLKADSPIGLLPASYLEKFKVSCSSLLAPRPNTRQGK